MSDQGERPNRANDTPFGGDRPAAPSPDTTDDSPRNAVGAYLLDALPADERAAFEAFLENSPDAQEELRQLAPVVGLLPQLLGLEPSDEETASPPAPALRGRILSAAEAERAAPPASVSTPAPFPPEADVLPDEPMEAIAGAAAAVPDATSSASTAAAERTPGEGTAVAAEAASAPSRTVRTAPVDAGPGRQIRRPAGQRSRAPRHNRCAPSPSFRHPG